MGAKYKRNKMKIVDIKFVALFDNLLRTDART